MVHETKYLYHVVCIKQLEVSIKEMAIVFKVSVSVGITCLLIDSF